MLDLLNTITGNLFYIYVVCYILFFFYDYLGSYEDREEIEANFYAVSNGRKLPKSFYVTESALASFLWPWYLINILISLIMRTIVFLLILAIYIFLVVPIFIILVAFILTYIVYAILTIPMANLADSWIHPMAEKLGVWAGKVYNYSLRLKNKLVRMFNRF